MLAYSATKKEFVEDVTNNVIHIRIQDLLGHRVGQSEIRSWRNSLRAMESVIRDDEIPDDAGVSIEFRIPLTSKRVDFILTGKDAEQNESAVIVELKQWDEVKPTEKDGVVRAFVGGGERELTHPSYQAWTYAALIHDFNETVREDSIALAPCAYLHNLDSGNVVNDPFYADHTDKAPTFISSDVQHLAAFLKKYVKYGDTTNIMYRIDNGKLKPSKNLVDSLVSMLKGNEEFLMIDDQKLVYETAREMSAKAQDGKKQVLIVRGGPGTGKSVVAVNLVVELTRQELLVQYVSKNAAPRAVYAEKLAGYLPSGRVKNLFKGSGSYMSTETDQFDALIVDEAHRLNEKSGFYGNEGEHQVKELINASKFSIFFIDEDQRVTYRDIGEVSVIRDFADKAGSHIEELELASQFRCNGSDGYLAWVDNVLNIRETANPSLEGIDYDFRVFADPIALHQEVRRLNEPANKARMVAGYCWTWPSAKDAAAKDIVIPEYGYAAQWNLKKHGSLWIMERESVEEVGCIHTCQGLELDYVGVIVGPDLVVRNGVVVTDATQRARSDASIKGFKKHLKENPDEALAKTDMIIKNTYRTLMTRGQKGCYLFSVDPETNEYFRRSAGQYSPAELLQAAEDHPDY